MFEEECRLNGVKMKRISKSAADVEFAHCKLFREDIQEIITLMTFDQRKPMIESDGYELDDEDDLFRYLGAKGRRTLSIKSSRPSVLLHTYGNSGGVRVVAYSDSADAIALLHRVSDIIKHCEIKESICESTAWASLSVGLVTGGVGGGFTSLLTHTTVIPLLGASMIAIGNFGMLARMIARSRSRTLFYGIGRHDRTSFWERKADDLMEKGVVALVSAIFAVFGTLVAQTLLRK